MKKIDQSEVWQLFHHLWGRSVGKEDYDKKSWQELDTLLHEVLMQREQALAVLKWLDEEGDPHGRCVICRSSPCLEDCRIRAILTRAGIV